MIGPEAHVPDRNGPELCAGAAHPQRREAARKAPIEWRVCAQLCSLPHSSSPRTAFVMVFPFLSMVKVPGNLSGTDPEVGREGFS